VQLHSSAYIAQSAVSLIAKNSLFSMKKQWKTIHTPTLLAGHVKSARIYQWFSTKSGINTYSSSK